jgi:hypothetical protein
MYRLQDARDNANRILDILNLPVSQAYDDFPGIREAQKEEERTWDAYQRTCIEAVAKEVL